MSLPMVGDYSDAIQNPTVCFDAPELAELAAGEVALHPRRGTPLVYAGNFAAVYPVVCGGEKYAVRCFTREIKDSQGRHERYRELDTFLNIIDSDAFVSFNYYDRGIRVKGDWYPMVRMSWVEGSRLDKFVEDNLSRPDRILEVCGRLLETDKPMRVLGIAHNDLQHGNVMVRPDDSLRLVDYDGIFLPRFRGQPSPELGHAQYQHPLRTEDDYGAYVDNFPALVLYLSLLALSHDPGLWQRFYTQDNLILTRADYADPANSECFRALKGSPDSTVRRLAGYLEECCSLPLEQIPDLERVLEDLPAVSVATAPAPPAQSAAAPPTAPSAASPSVITCPQCNLSNPVELVYCDDEGCASVLYPSNRFCAYCGESVPVNGNYCPECGLQLT